MENGQKVKVRERRHEQSVRIRMVWASFTGDARSRLDFMAVHSESAAVSAKGSGVLAGVADSRITRQNRAEPPVREHRRSGVTND